MLQGCKNSHSKSSDSLSSASVCVCSSRILLKKKIQLTVFYKNAKNEIESIKISNSSYQASQTWKITLQDISINPSCSKGHKNINSIKARRWFVEVVWQNKKLNLKMPISWGKTVSASRKRNNSARNIKIFSLLIFIISILRLPIRQRERSIVNNIIDCQAVIG